MAPLINVQNVQMVMLLKRSLWTIFRRSLGQSFQRLLFLRIKSAPLVENLKVVSKVIGMIRFEMCGWEGGIEKWR